MGENERVVNIKYKQMDKDPQINKVVNEMEKMILGAKGIGLLQELGLTPGRIQKSLDDQWEKEFQELIEENKDYIFWESRKRSATHVQDWLSKCKDKGINEKELTEEMKRSIKLCEIEVIKELVEKNL